jgi:hypothetical protein
MRLSSWVVSKARARLRAEGKAAAIGALVGQSEWTNERIDE